MHNTLSATLNDGHKIPRLGFGTWKIDDEITAEKVCFALKTGYRHIDTAKIYGNEAGVGQGMRRSGLPRGEIFLTTKLWNEDQGYDSALRACEESLKRLNTDYIDLYLIHWPVPAQNLFADSWKALIRLREQGLVRSIGVSNFRIEDLNRIINETGITPAVNQIELHPYFQQAELRAFHQQRGILTESWSPLGRGAELADPVIQRIASAHGKTAAQIVLRWHIEIGCIVFPKSVTDSRIAENFDIFDFSLTDAEKDAIKALDKKDGRMSHDPATFSAPQGDWHKKAQAEAAAPKP